MPDPVIPETALLQIYPEDTTSLSWLKGYPCSIVALNAVFSFRYALPESYTLVPEVSALVREMESQIRKLRHSTSAGIFQIYEETGYAVVESTSSSSTFSLSRNIVTDQSVEPVHVMMVVLAWMIPDQLEALKTIV